MKKITIIYLSSYLLLVSVIFGFLYNYYSKIDIETTEKTTEISFIIENLDNDITDISDVSFEEMKAKNYILTNSDNKTIDYADDIVKYTKQYTRNKEDFLLMIGLYYVESKFNVNAISYLGAKSGRSLGQVSEIALDDYNWKNGTNYKPSDLFDIETNIKISCWLFYHYLDNYNFSIEECIMAYNMGCGNIKKGNYNYKYLNKVITEFGRI